MSERSVAIRCYAKVNLGLRILGRRSDGYHEIRSLLQTIDLHDTLEAAPGSGFRLEVVPDEAGLPLTDLPPVPGNLVMKAADALRERLGDRGAAFRLRKRIPVQSGLGGGSSDAAAALLALDRLHGLRMKPAEMHEVAASLGADVPFFLLGGAGLALGRGEEVYPLPDGPPMHMVVAVPGEGNATVAVYEAWDRLLTSPDKACRMNDFAPWSLAIRGGTAGLANDLEEAAIRLRPALRELRRTLENSGTRSVAMTGSGSAFIGLCEGEEAAATAARLAREAGYDAITAKSLGRGERDRTLWLAR